MFDIGGNEKRGQDVNWGLRRASMSSTSTTATSKKLIATPGTSTTMAMQPSLDRASEHRQQPRMPRSKTLPILSTIFEEDENTEPGINGRTSGVRDGLLGLRGLRRYIRRLRERRNSITMRQPALRPETNRDTQANMLGYPSSSSRGFGAFSHDSPSGGYESIVTSPASDSGSEELIDLDLAIPAPRAALDPTTGTTTATSGTGATSTTSQTQSPASTAAAPIAPSDGPVINPLAETYNQVTTTHLYSHDAGITPSSDGFWPPSTSSSLDDPAHDDAYRYSPHDRNVKYDDYAIPAQANSTVIDFAYRGKGAGGVKGHALRDGPIRGRVVVGMEGQREGDEERVKVNREIEKEWEEERSKEWAYS